MLAGVMEDKLIEALKVGYVAIKENVSTSLLNLVEEVIDDIVLRR